MAKDYVRECPFCGSQCTLIHRGKDTGFLGSYSKGQLEVFYITCANDKCQYRSAKENTKEEIITRHNDLVVNYRGDRNSH